METNFLKYQLQSNYIHNWLVSEPFSLPGSDNPQDARQANTPEITPKIIAQSYPAFMGKPNEHDQIKKDHHNRWKWFECRDDHFIDFSNDFQKASRVDAYAFTSLKVQAKENSRLNITTNASITVWLNRKMVCQFTNTGQNLQSAETDISLKKGENTILLQLEAFANRQTSIYAAVRVTDINSVSEILLPNHEVEPGDNENRQIIEKIIENGFLSKYVYGSHTGDKYDSNEAIPILFSENLKISGSLNIRLQDLDGYIYEEGEKIVRGGHAFSSATAVSLREGSFQYVTQPTANDYYIRKMMFDRRHRFFMVRSSHSPASYSTIEERKAELIKAGTLKKSKNIFPEVAKMSAGKWDYLDNKRIQDCLKSINQRQDGSILNLVGFLGMIYRFGIDPSFPSALKQSIQDACIQYCYWSDEPETEGMDFTSEAKSLLFHTGEILAGQLEKSSNFTNNGETGEVHRNHGISKVFDWIEQRGNNGFEDWNSSESYAEILTALAHLVDFCEEDSLTDLAAVMIDKILFLLAANTFKGGLGGPHARCQVGTIVTSRLEPTSGVCRLMWGMGVFNYELAAPLSLALSKYEMPEMIAQIATDSVVSLWIQQSHSSRNLGENNENRVNLSLYKTRDYLLSSCQDYLPGKAGNKEHVWQATLGPDAVVFTNHPACTSDSDVHIPNLWRGNKTLPRICQWGDFLLAIYNLPEDDWLGYTHAYFPVAAFDEYAFSGNWAFARKDNAFLALFASQGFDFVKEGYSAFRELRSVGRQNIWLCQMGHSLLDGSFMDFQNHIQSLDFNINDLTFSGKNLRKDEITFGWQGPLLVNGQEQALSAFPHHQSMYCQADYPAGKMVIMHGDEGLQLNFEIKPG